MTSFKSKLGLILFGWTLLHPTAFASEQRLRGLGIGLQTKDPTEAPVPAPVTAPVSVSVPAPVTAPVPVPAPVTGVVVPAPVTAPVPAPVTVPVPAPVTVPVPAPAPVADVPAGPTIAATASANDALQTLVKVLIKLDLVSILNSCEGPKFTVFAPTDEAFGRAFDISKIDDLTEAELDDLKAVVLFHVVPDLSGQGPIMAADIGTGMVVVTALPATGKVACNTLVFDVTDTGGVFVNDAQVIIPNVAACNGVVHVIDRVLYAPGVLEH